MKNFLSVIKRFGRVAVAVVIAGLPAYFGDNPLYMTLTPVINALGKFLRSTLGLKYIPF